MTGPAADQDPIARQLLLWYAKKVDGLWLYQVEGVASAKLDSQGAKKRTKTDPGVTDLTFKSTLNPYFMVPVFDRQSDAWIQRRAVRIACGSAVPRGRPSGPADP